MAIDYRPWKLADIYCHISFLFNAAAACKAIFGLVADGGWL